MFSAAVMCLLGWGCSGGDQAQEPGPSRATSGDSLTFEKQIEQQINLVMDRLRYDDRSGLWENELEYFYDEMTFDEYLKIGRISNASADTLEFIEVRKITEFPDSLVLSVGVHFRGPSGRESILSDQMTMYRKEGRWVKPTLSHWQGQAAFDSVRQEAIDAATREAGR